MELFNKLCANRTSNIFLLSNDNSIPRDNYRGPSQIIDNDNELKALIYNVKAKRLSPQPHAVLTNQEHLSPNPSPENPNTLFPKYPIVKMNTPSFAEDGVADR